MLMESLPSHVLIHAIFKYLLPRWIGRLACCNRYLSNVCRSEETWKTLYRRDLSEVRVPNGYRGAYREFFRRLGKNSYYHEYSYHEYSKVLAEFGYEKQLFPAIVSASSLYGLIQICEALTQPYRDIIERLLHNGKYDVRRDIFLQLIKFRAENLLEEYFKNDPINAIDGADGIDDAGWREEVFLTAARSNYLPMIESHLKSGSNEDIMEGICSAISHNHINVVRVLIGSNVSWNMDLVYQAVKVDNVEAYQLLSTIFPEKDFLYTAINYNSWKVVKYIIQHQFKLPHYECLLSPFRHKQYEIVRLLIEKGVDYTEILEMVRATPLGPSDYYDEEKQELCRYILSLPPYVKP